jgi:tRNA nucleotidyltransferase (CCA-adding enzyme)
MLDRHVKHSDVAAFADERINLKRDDVQAYREQVGRLRTKLVTYIAAHPGFDLVKILHSGSVAKGTALRTINDMDVAVYVRAGSAPEDEKKLIHWLKDRLQEAYGDLLNPDQFLPQHHCVTVSFRGSGLDVDIVPVLYEGGADDLGYLITKDTGDRVLTSIPLHLKFTRTRKDAHKRHYRQMVRLVKWWARIQKNERDDFRFKSFMIELLLAHLFDNGLDGSDYAEALFTFFAYIVRTRLDERIVFSDYYDTSKLVAGSGMPIQIFDPVNPGNNIAARYSPADRDAIVDAAEDALDAIAFARRATTKGVAIDQWQTILGTGFKGGA